MLLILLYFFCKLCICCHFQFYYIYNLLLKLSFEGISSNKSLGTFKRYLFLIFLYNILSFFGIIIIDSNIQSRIMSFVACTIYFILTVVIPLKQTMKAVNENHQVKLWAIYWALYSFINAIVWMIPFLDNGFSQLIHLCIFVSLYHQSIKGALVLEKFIVSGLSKNPAIGQNINMIAQKLAFLKMFESNKPIEKVKAA